MPKVKNVEKRIWDTEAFDVIIRHTDGRDMRGDKNDVTVADWKARRFAGIYPSLAIDVLDGDGNAVAGNTQLGTIKDSYADE